MKKIDILFYTFLSIFIVTAVITLLGILDVLQIRPGYLDTLVGVFVIELAGAVIALFRKADFFTDESTMSKEEQSGQYEHSVESHNDVTEPEPLRDLSAAEYFKMFHDLDDRFHEQEEFAKQYHGRTVCWKGFVNSVSTWGGDILIQLKESNDLSSNLFHASFPEDLRTKAYALHKGDVIEVTGELNAISIPHAPRIRGASFTLGKKGTSN